MVAYQLLRVMAERELNRSWNLKKLLLLINIFQLYASFFSTYAKVSYNLISKNFWKNTSKI